LNWPGTAVSTLPELTAELPPDDPRWPLLRERVRQSRDVQTHIIAPNRGDHRIGSPLLVPLGNDLAVAAVNGGRLQGRPTIACPVFENVEMVEANVGRLKGYDAVVVASRWNQEVLAGFGVEAALCHEGIDPIIFNPSVRRKRDDGRFRVFSGGKVEWRKGQDLVIEAFKLFAEKHDDAVLVAAWGSPFGASPDFEGRWEHGSPPGWHIGRPNFHAWTQRAGIKPHQFEFVEPRPNWRMAEVYGGVDVALFPNRCEGGTNFVAMEAMACGVPVVYRGDFGQQDLIDCKGWLLPTIGDEVEGIVHGLNVAYEGVVTAGLSPGYWTWDRHCKQMAEIIAGV
jgi:glycosyltransferase involved in cell wall biosynthesis